MTPADADTPRTAANETSPLREMARRQFDLLISRHRAEDVILVRVLVEHYQHVAQAVKDGQLALARSQLSSLAKGVPLPAHEELTRVIDVGALPVRALVEWREGEHRTARLQILDALDACGELSDRWGHDYLTGKQFHLAANIARVMITEGDEDGTIELLAALRTVALDGDRTRWPFIGTASLDVPLQGLWRASVEEELQRVASHMTGLRK
ncbi:hypothetical protein QA860_25405 [Streptomyces stelliscabiei]|uniref:hypothetical protein n=1 Tax=Streptomyces stelliscabiei TaxID=146820 RepID=UPI002FF2EBE8